MADLVDCMVALPGQLFYSTQIPVCLWFLAKNKNDGAGKSGFRDRRKQTLFIDARKLGTLIDRVHRELTDADIAKITSTHHAWRSNPPQSPFAKGGSAKVPPFEKGGLGGIYQDIPGFCKSADLDLIKQHGYVLTWAAYGLLATWLALYAFPPHVKKSAIFFTRIWIVPK